MDILLHNVSADLGNRLLNEKVAEVAFRDSKQRFELMEKILVGNPLENLGGGGMHGAVAKLNGALQMANFVATIVCTIIICDKLDRMDQKLDEIQKTIDDVKDINYEMQIAGPCRELIDDYKLLADHLGKGETVSASELMNLIRKYQSQLVSLYNLTGKIPMDAALDLIFTMLPIYTNCIMLYYQNHYDEEQGKNALHDGWMSVFAKLNSDELLNQIQDDLFLNQKRTNRQVNEYLAYHRMVVKTYNQKIDQLIADLEACGGEEGYNEAMQWSRQYVAQQAKSKQVELEDQFGSEKAKEMMEQALEIVTA